MITNKHIEKFNKEINEVLIPHIQQARLKGYHLYVMHDGVKHSIEYCTPIHGIGFTASSDHAACPMGTRVKLDANYFIRYNIKNIQSAQKYIKIDLSLNDLITELKDLK